MLKRIRHWYDDVATWLRYDLRGKPRPLFGYIEDGHAYVVYSDGSARRGGSGR